MIRLRHVAAFACALVATGAMAQAITFYENDGFRGRNFSQDGPIADFQHFGFNDQASSVVIRRGAWEVCTDARFGGNCVTLRAGSYPNLGAMGMGNRISSARPAGGPGMRPPPPMPAPPPYAPPHKGRSNAVTLFDSAALTGARFHVDGDIPNLDRTQWNDRARSMIVRQGRWQICTDANFRGNCMVFGPGRYDNIGNQTGSASSIRRVR
ncbi:MAG TPA: beta/gamma crystallin-related protein [Casimicrobiaceae bacterium]